MDLKPHKKKIDWWVGYTSDLLPILRGVPGINIYHGGKMEIHRTHLPLLGIPTLDYQTPLHDRNRFDIFSACRIQNAWKLRSYQHDARDFILSRRGTLLADIQRSGKTPTIVSSYSGSGRLLVIAPRTVRPVWFQWIETVHPGIKAVYVTSRIYDKEQFKYADAIFCNYDIMGEWTSFGASQDKFELVVLDEAHLLSNTKSKRSVGCLGAAMSGERVVAATATPLWNTPDGLHNILSYLNPKGWGTWPEFTIRYCNAEPGTFGWSLGEPSNVDEFQDRLSEVMLRRTWGDILGELPKIGRSIEIVDLTRKDRLELDHHLYSLLSSVENKIPQVGIDAHLRDVLGCLKLKTAADTARRFLEAHEDVVIWTWHKNLANGAKERLSRQGFSAYVTTGDDSDSVQTETLDAWRRDPNPSALVLTIGVGQVGIDLSKARHCIFAELDYTPVVISQAEMRTFSKDRPMTVTYILADHELDHRLLKTILRKCKEAYELGTPTTETDLDVLRAAFSMEKPDLKAVVDGL